MNILYVCADRGIPLCGNKGASAHVRAITGALQRNGHTVVVVARNVGGDNQAPDVSATANLDSDQDAATMQLKDLIADIRADLVVERHSLQSGAARRASEAGGVPQLLEVNAPLVEEATRWRGLDDTTAHAREQETLRRADLIQVVSPTLLRFVRSVAPAVPSRWIPNGVAYETFRTAARREIPGLGCGPVVGFLGSMKPWHGVDDLIDAFARVRQGIPGAQLLLVGGGPEEDALRHRVKTSGLSNSVIFTGQVEQRDVPGYLRCFDVAVAPFLAQPDFYFYPLKVLEYLAAGVPIVYSDQGALRELIGSAGLGYEAGSVVQLADRVQSLLSDEILRTALASEATARAENADWSAIADRVIRFTREVLQPG